MEKQAEIATFIEGLTSNLSTLIKLYTPLNASISFLDKNQCEMLAAKCHDTICGGTGGGGWDNIDKSEVKSTSHIQSRKCACKKKVSFFSERCPHCNRSMEDRKIPRDGRWGIDAESHFDYKEELNEYRLFLTEPVNESPSCREFRIRYWMMSKESEHFNRYALAQMGSKKSKQMNFQPLKADFFLSKPVLRFEGLLTLMDNSSKMEFSYFNLNNTEPVEIPAEFVNMDSTDTVSKKNFNKERGLWVRN